MFILDNKKNKDKHEKKKKKIWEGVITARIHTLVSRDQERASAHHHLQLLQYNRVRERYFLDLLSYVAVVFHRQELQHQAEEVHRQCLEELYHREHQLQSADQA